MTKGYGSLKKLEAKVFNCIVSTFFHFMSSSKKENLLAIDHEDNKTDRFVCSEIQSLSEKLKVLLEIKPRHEYPD